MKSGASRQRACIYQLFLRLFSNTNETRKCNGTLAENGVGKFAEINAAALTALKEMGFTHVWLTGVFQQATGTDYSQIGAPADDPDLLKGLAGSPYAIKDYFDVCPDYAVRPEDRLAEFQALIARMHDAGLGVILDFVGNHVARSYSSDVRPDLDFGARDDRAKFFDPQNDFFYLQKDSPGGGPPLRLPTAAGGQLLSPTCKVLGSGDGLFSGELDHGKVTGNNVVSWAPSLSDWYETIKLNYGYDFTTGLPAYPDSKNAELAIPDTWEKMDAVLAYWQEMGIDGFRCDMAHLVPLEFWKWAVARARGRQGGVFFVAEAYDNDPMKAYTGNALEGLLHAGFDGVYDDPSYKNLKGVYDGQNWANDLDDLGRSDLLFHRSLRYAENHDEVRLAGANQWGGIGMEVGRAVSAILFGIGRGPVLLYNGQEIGEPARGAAGYSGEGARTTIFDYWSMPELAKWVNGHRYDGGRLSEEQKSLRAFYSRLLHLVAEPAFSDGEFYSLNPANRWNTRFARPVEESASGHWLYAYLRFDPATGQRVLAIANLHPVRTVRDTQIYIPKEAVEFLRLHPQQIMRFEERLLSSPTPVVADAVFTDNRLMFRIDCLPPLTPAFFELWVS